VEANNANAAPPTVSFTAERFIVKTFRRNTAKIGVA
jgi:hypothetical protein